MDEQQCCRATVAVVRLVVVAQEAKEGLPWAAEEEAEALRRPQQRRQHHSPPPTRGACSGTALAVS